MSKEARAFVEQNVPNIALWLKDNKVTATKCRKLYNQAIANDSVQSWDMLNAKTNVSGVNPKDYFKPTSGDLDFEIKAKFVNICLCCDFFEYKRVRFGKCGIIEIDNNKKIQAMKSTKLNLLGFAMAFCALTSCVDTEGDNPQPYSNALVTVKTTSDNKTFLQLDEQTTLFPQNFTSQLYGGKEVRALICFNELDKQTPGFSKTVHVNWIDSIRTKNMINLSPDTPAEKYGNDPVEIVNDWVTVAEDGYLTLRVRTLWGNIGKAHTFNLLGKVNPDNPFEVELRHNANGDIHGKMADALVAFRISAIPHQYAPDQKLTLRWKSFDGGLKQAYFKMFLKSTANRNIQEVSELRTPDEIL